MELGAEPLTDEQSIFMKDLGALHGFDVWDRMKTTLVTDLITSVSEACETVEVLLFVLA